MRPRLCSKPDERRIIMTTDRSGIPFSKRLTDVAIGSGALLLLGPVMLAVAALVKLASKGPALYVARRAGYQGRPFGQLKFRTMHLGADRQGSVTAKDDPRVFPLGRVLRLFKLDELPQILNVLRGEMSVVGPRPEDVDVVRDCYTAEQRQILDVPPGLTCLPEVRFFPDFTVIDTGGMDPQQHYRQVLLPMRLDMDLEYLRTRSFWLDLRLIFHTAYLVLVQSWKILIFGQEIRSLPSGRSRVAGAGTERC